jgi:hypothetical protein
VTTRPFLPLMLVVILLDLLGALSLVAGAFSYSQSVVNSREIISLNGALDRQAASAKATGGDQPPIPQRNQLHLHHLGGTSPRERPSAATTGNLQPRGTHPQVLISG